MGYDLYISEQTDFRIDSKGRQQHTVTQLLSLCGEVAKALEEELGTDLDNCRTANVDAMDIISVLHSCQEYVSKRGQYKQDAEDSQKHLNHVYDLIEEQLNLGNVKEILDSKDYLAKRRIIQKLNEELKEAFCEAEAKHRMNKYYLHMVDVREELEGELEEFIKENEIDVDDTEWGERTFEVHIWY